MTNQHPTFLAIPWSDLPASSSFCSLHLCWISGQGPCLAMYYIGEGKEEPPSLHPAWFCCLMASAQEG